MSFPSTIPLRRDAPGVFGSNSELDFTGFAAVGLLLFAVIFVWVCWHRRGGIPQKANLASHQSFWLRWLGSSPIPNMKQVSSTRLTAQHTLHEVDWNGKRLLIGCADHSICLIADLSEAAPADRYTSSVEESP